MLPGWLYATTRNVAVDFVRAEQRRRAREQEAQAMHELTSPPATDATWEQMRPLLDATMDELSDAEREIVVAAWTKLSAGLAEFGANVVPFWPISHPTRARRVSDAIQGRW